MADLGGAGARPPPPWAPKFFRFHAVFGKIWQNRMLAPPGELAPPWGNPGSGSAAARLGILFSRVTASQQSVTNLICLVYEYQ